MLWIALLLLPMVSQTSTIRSSSIIAVVRVNASHPGAWTAGPKQTRIRTVELDLVIERMLKGPEPSHPIHITIEQSEPGPRVVALPGAWSGKSVDPGAVYVLFTHTDLSQADRVEPAESEAAVKLTLESDHAKSSLQELLKKTPANALNVLMGEYILDRLNGSLLSDYTQFDVVLSFLESPTTPSGFRQQVLSGIFTTVMNADPSPERFWSRLTIAGFRVAALRPDPLREAILSTFLPNLLGLTGGLSPKPAHQVFRNFPSDRENAREQARQSPVLMQWLTAN